MLLVENLHKDIKIEKLTYEILKGISLGINEGEYVGIMGPSGSGKTTLLNVISTIDDISSGKIILDNIDITKLSADKKTDFRRKNIGFIFQDFNLLDNMTVEDNIALPLALSLENISNIKEKVNNLTNILNITEHLNKYPYQLSGGQKQRVATARALISEPKIIFADEPTGALDTKSSRELLEELSKLNKEMGKTIFMVTHDINAASYCDRVLLIKDGKIHDDLKNESNNKKDFYVKIQNNLLALVGEQE